MRNIATFIFFVLIVASACETKTEIAYPSPVPSDRFEKFLPNIVSRDSAFEFNSLFGPDGKTFFFSRNEIHDIYSTAFDGSQWSSPTLTSFSEKEYKECDPAFSPDGSKLYYISTRKTSLNDTTDDFNIWFVEREGDTWSEPKNLEIVNSDSAEFYVSFAKNGNLYFASNRQGTIGSFDIYVSRFVDGAYTKPENVGEGVNEEHMEHDPFINGDENLIIFTSVNREGGFGRGDLYYSIKDSNGEWTKAKNLGPTVNGSGYDFCPYITPDGKYFFYSDNSDIKWINIEHLNKIVAQ